VAYSSVNVTEGSGKRLNTWDRTVSSVLVQEQYVQAAEPAAASYWTIAYSGSTATGAAHLVQIMAGSSLYVRIRRIAIMQKTAAGTAQVGEFDILRLTTAGTGGSALGINKADTADAAAGATAMSLPSSKGTEGLSVAFTSLLMSGSSTTVGTVDTRAEWVAAPGTKGIVIAPGTSNGIAVKNNNAIASGTVTVVVEFVETSYL
jgi:hypothetical protein